MAQSLDPRVLLLDPMNYLPQLLTLLTQEELVLRFDFSLSSRLAESGAAVATAASPR